MQPDAKQIGDDGESSENDVEQIDFSLLHTGHLFGREQDVEKLHDTVHRLLRDDNLQSELILLSGESGTGKTSLAKSIEQYVDLKDGFFITGKCDQLQTVEPYAAIVAAITDFVFLVLLRGEDTINRVKEILLRVSGSDGGLLLDMIPALRKIIGKLEPSTLKGETAQKRLKQIFREFLLALCSNNCPLVMVLDDLHWADVGSLEMLDLLISDKKVQGLVVLGSCCPDEMSFDHHLAALLRKLEDENKALITHIEVKNISSAATIDLISNAMKLPGERCKSLATVVYGKSKGNILFTMLLLQKIRDEGIFQMGPDGEWSCDEMALSDIVSNVDTDIELISHKIKQLPHDVQIMLNYAACMGGEINEYILTKILMDTDVPSSLSIAINEGLVIHEKLHNRYLFSHDAIQQAAFSISSTTSEEATNHLFLGRMLLTHLSTNQVTKHIFLVVNQFYRGLSRVRDQAERDSIAALCLRAGEKSILANDLRTAAKYLWLGIDLLGNRKWRNQYQLSLELYNIVAETEYCLGDFEKMDSAVLEVLSNARNFKDGVWISTTQLYALYGRTRLNEALSGGLTLLNRLGESFPEPSPLNLIADIMKIRLLLRGKTDAEILQLPDIENNEKLGVLGMLSLLAVISYHSQQKHFSLIGNRMIRISLKYGICPVTAVGFVIYGVICCTLGNYEEGNRYGNLAIRLLDKYGKAGIEWVPRVHAVVYGFIAPYKCPIQTLTDKILKAHRVGMEVGDIEWAMLATRPYSILSWMSGEKLSVLEEKLQLHRELMSRCRHGLWTVGNNLQLQMVHNFLGKSKDPLVLKGEIIIDDVKEFEEATVGGNRSFYAQFFFWRLVLAYHFGEIELALEYAKKIRREHIMRSFIFGSTYHFYRGMAALSMAWDCKRHKYIRVAKKILKNLKKILKSCPANFGHMVILLEAEIESVGKNFELAMSLYDKAILVAGEKGFIQFEALACERAGQTLIRKSSKVKGKEYLNRAVVLYNEWGAGAKSKHMIRELELSFPHE